MTDVLKFKNIVKDALNEFKARPVSSMTTAFVATPALTLSDALQRPSSLFSNRALMKNRADVLRASIKSGGKQFNNADVATLIGDIQEYARRRRVGQTMVAAGILGTGGLLTDKHMLFDSKTEDI